MRYTFDIASLTEAQLREIASLYVTAGWDDEAAAAEEIRRLLEASFLVVCAIDDSGTVAGTARAISDGVSDAYVQDVVVNPACRRRGIGREMVKRLFAELKRRGIEWRALVGVPGTESFYRGCGLTAEPDHTLWLDK